MVVRIDGEAVGLYGTTSVVRLRSGAIVIAHPQEARVIALTPDGRRLAESARPGEGPGEFRWPVYLTPSGDSLWVLDGILPRMTLLDHRLRLVRTEPRPVALASPDGTRPAMGSPYALARHSDGSVLASAFVDKLLHSGAPARGHSAVVRLAPDGTLLRILGSKMPRSEPCGFRSANGARSVPACRGPLSAHAPTGSYWALASADTEGGDAGHLAVWLIAGSGDTLHHTTIRYTPQPITRGMADSIRRAAIMEAQSPAAKALAREMTLKSNLPPLDWLAVGADGTTWLGMRAVGGRREWRNLNRFGREGVPLVLPAAARVRYADADQLITTEERSDGFEDVVVYQRARQ